MRKSKPSEEYDQPSEQELLNRMMRIPNIEYRSYAAFTYLFGNRVSEGIQGTSKFKDRKSGEIKERHYSAIKAGDFLIDDSGWIEVRNVPTLKRKVKDVTKFYRDLLVYQYGEGEQPFVDILKEHISSKDRSEVLWNRSRKTYWHYFNKYLLIPPKLLRSLRAKKDAKVYKLGALELKEKYNWGTTDMPFHYARFNKDALKAKIKESVK